MASDIKARMAPVLRLMSSFFISILFSNTLSLAEIQRSAPPRAKRVFTNEDLQKYQERSESESTRHLQTDAFDSVGREANSDTLQTKEIRGSNLGSSQDLDQSYWVNKLKEADRNLSKAKTEELRFNQGLTEFQEKLGKAQTDFQKQTARWQIEDSEKNLVRAREGRKKAETERTKVLEDALRKGFKAEELKDKAVNLATEQAKDGQNK